MRFTLQRSFYQVTKINVKLRLEQHKVMNIHHPVEYAPEVNLRGASSFTQ